MSVNNFNEYLHHNGNKKYTTMRFRWIRSCWQRQEHRSRKTIARMPSSPGVEWWGCWPVRRFALNGSNKGQAHLDCLEIVEMSHSGLDVVFVGLLVDDEDESVVLFNLLHRALSGMWSLDDWPAIKLVSLWNGLAGEPEKTRWNFHRSVKNLRWSSWSDEGLWSSEMNRGTDIFADVGLVSLDNCLLGFNSLSHLVWWRSHVWKGYTDF